jgi:hypothetical protein
MIDNHGRLHGAGPMRRILFILPALLLPGAVVLWVFRDKPMRATTASATRSNVDVGFYGQPVRTEPLSPYMPPPPPIPPAPFRPQDVVPKHPPQLHVHQIPARLDPTDDAVLATTIDTKFRHLGPVQARVMSPCGNRIAAVCEAEGVIREWDVCSGEEVRQFKLPNPEDLEDKQAFTPCLMYRADKQQLLYLSARGRITNFSTDTGRVVSTFRHQAEDAYRQRGRASLSADGEYVVKQIGYEQQAIYDTATGAELYRTTKNKLSEVRWAQFSPDNRYVVLIGFQCVCVLDWKNDAKPMLLTPMHKIKEHGYHQDKLVVWIDESRFVVQVDGTMEGSRCDVYNAQTGEIEPLRQDNSEVVHHLVGVQNGVGYGVSVTGKPVHLVPLTLQIITDPVKPYQPILSERLQERTQYGELVYQQDWHLAAPESWVTPIKKPDNTGNYQNTIRQLVYSDGTKQDLAEYSTALDRWTGTFAELKDINGQYRYSRDGRWLAKYTYPQEGWEISSAKVGSKVQLEESFDKLPFIHRNSRNDTCGVGLFGKPQSMPRYPSEFYVTTDGRVFGIRSGSDDDDPRTTFTVRHVDHPDWKYLTHFQLPGTGSINNQYTVSFHPNERLIFVALQHPNTTESELRCYELATLSEVFRYKHPRGVMNVKFDSKGERMLLDHKDYSMTVIDFPKFLTRQLKPADATQWLSDDASLAIPAMRALAKQPDAAAVVQQALKQRKPDITADLLNLGDANYRTREAATERLRMLGDEIAPELQAALATTTDEEVHQRLTQLVRAAVPMYGLTRQQFRELRAKEVLEIVKSK